MVSMIKRNIILDKLAEEVVLVHANLWNKKLRINIETFYIQDFFRDENVRTLRKNVKLAEEVVLVHAHPWIKKKNYNKCCKNLRKCKCIFKRFF